MIAAYLVLVIGVADVAGWLAARFAGPRRRVPAQFIAILGSAAAVTVLAALTAQVGWWAVAVLLVGITWPILTELWPATAVAYLALVAATVVFAPAASTGVRFGAISAEALLTGGAVAIFLGLSANLVCRAALDRARVTDAPSLVTTAPAPATATALRQAFAARYLPAPRLPGQLRGGRLIGPLERWFILFLAIAGAQGIVVALLAAKGIVRFPEINKDEKDGTKAEEFLIGSLISWGFAGAGAVLVLTSGVGF